MQNPNTGMAYGGVAYANEITNRRFALWKEIYKQPNFLEIFIANLGGTETVNHCDFDQNTMKFDCTINRAQFYNFLHINGNSIDSSSLSRIIAKILLNTIRQIAVSNNLQISDYIKNVLYDENECNELFNLTIPNTNYICIYF